MVRALAILVLTLCMAVAAQATRFYKWVDEDGVVHYSDTRPDHERYEQLDVREPPSLEDELEAAGIDPSEEDPALAKTEAAAAAERAAQEARRTSCTNARTTLSELTSNENVAMDLDGDGSLETLNEIQRQAQIQVYRSQVAQFCTDD